jgi:predicted short-subunit dehydrogenase-like oxidoreductase (DUF2520 family)
MQNSVSTKTIGIIGTGAVGSALAVLLRNAGYPVAGIAGRNKERSAELLKKLNLQKGDATNEEIVVDSDVIFFCLPDDELSDEINRCVKAASSFAGKLFFHTSGALSSNLFDPFRKKGALAASFHPLQSIPKNNRTVSLKDFAVTVEGDQPAVDYAFEIIQKIGAKPVLIEPGQKVMYHATATLASNGLVGLSGVVEEMIDAVGLGEEGREHFYKLMGQSLDNSRTMTAPDAITGPAARGDIATLKQHLNTLRQQSPHIVPIYVVIGSHCVSLAIRSGTISQERGEAILDLFSNELQSLTM